jgi:hypothetical protein
MYWGTELSGIECYSAYDELAKHPEWLMKDDKGNVLKNKLDYSVPAAVDWWVNVPLNHTASGVLDGILADNAGWGAIPGVSHERLAKRNTAKVAMINEVQHRLKEVTVQGWFAANVQWISSTTELSPSGAPTA